MLPVSEPMGMTDAGRSTDRLAATAGRETASRAVGDRRWTGTGAHLGHRATQRSPGSMHETVVTTTAGDRMAVPELPSLEPDCYLLEPDAVGDRARREALLTSLHGLALDEALASGGDVLWIDAQGHATTHALARVAPGDRALERVHVARAFTTHQHHTLVERLARWLRGDDDSPYGVPSTDRPAVVVCPALDLLYRDGELRTGTAKRLLVRAVAALAGIARDHDVPVVATRSATTAFTRPVDAATTTITLEQTTFGPRFECDALDFETVVYETDDDLVQTTFAFWRRVLAERHPDASRASGVADANRGGGRDARRSAAQDATGTATELAAADRAAPAAPAGPAVGGD